MVILRYLQLAKKANIIVIHAVTSLLTLMEKTSYKWRKYLPNIALGIRLPFFTLETRAMYERYDAMIVEWVSVYIKIYKWSFDFKWYWKPGI